MSLDDLRLRAAEACQSAAEMFLTDKVPDARKQLMKALYASDKIRAELRRKKNKRLPVVEIGSDPQA